MKYETLRDGSNVLLRQPGLDDLGSLMRFFAELPAEDRKFMRLNVTDPKNIERRVRQSLAGEIRRLVALHDTRVVGDCWLELSHDSWRSHVAEIRAFVAPDFRRKHLGALLIQAMFKEAQKLGVERVEVKMAEPQSGPRRICERLGFHMDAVLPDYIKDADGNPQSLLIMSCTLDEMWHELQDFYKETNWPDG